MGYKPLRNAKSMKPRMTKDEFIDWLAKKPHLSMEATVEAKKAMKGISIDLMTGKITKIGLDTLEPTKKDGGIQNSSKQGLKPLKNDPRLKKGHSKGFGKAPKLPKVPKVRIPSKLEAKFEMILGGLLLGTTINLVWWQQFKFHPTRRWKIDFYEATSKTAVEIEGGAFSRNGHRTITNFNADMEKYNELTYAGIHLIRLSAKTITHENVKRIIEFCLSKNNSK